MTSAGNVRKRPIFELDDIIGLEFNAGRIRGLCACGCGRRTTIAAKSGKGYKRGEPRRWCKGHQPRAILRKEKGSQLRVRQLQSTSKMTREQIMAAHTIYRERLLTVQEVADLVWQRFGYTNADTCARCLARLFRSFGLPMHTAGGVLADRAQCLGCGCPRDTFTPGCTTCHSRKYRRKIRGTRRPGVTLKPSTRVSHATANQLWPREKIIRAIQVWNNTHGKPPTSIEWQRTEQDHPSFMTVVERFGSWNSGIEAAGFQPRRRGRPKLAA